MAKFAIGIIIEKVVEAEDFDDAISQYECMTDLDKSSELYYITNEETGEQIDAQEYIKAKFWN